MSLRFAEISLCFVARGRRCPGLLSMWWQRGGWVRGRDSGTWAQRSARLHCLPCGAPETCVPRVPPPPRLTGPRSKGADGVTQVVPRPLQERPAMPDSLWRSASTLGEATYPLLSVRKAGTVTERGGAAELWGPLGRRSAATEGTRGVRSACCHVGTVCQLQRTM